MFDKTREIIENYIQTNWSSTDIKFPDIPYTPVDDNDWIDFDYTVHGSDQADIGAAQQRHRAVCSLGINIYTKPNRGSKHGRSLGDNFAQLFRSKEILQDSVYVLFKSPRVTNLGVVGNWHQTNVSVEFTTESLFTV